MSETSPNNHTHEDLDQMRLLTEVDHLLAGRLPDGTFDPAVIQEVRPNYETAVQEIAMPYAISTTTQRVVHEMDANGREQRVLKWLGRSAIEVAESGYQYHFSKPAFSRVAVEVEEARHNQDSLDDDSKTKVLISPRMSSTDAPKELAEQEHLYADDAIRTSQVIKDAQGNVIAFQIQSLLVRDIPLEAWTSMLQDPQNIFGKALPIRDETSALSVMELFKELALPTGALENGPVSLVEAVVPYISDAVSKTSVESQIVRFKTDQELYKDVAEAKAEEWLQFDKELAESLYSGQATYAIKQFIIGLQEQWGDEDLALLENHNLGNCDYLMTRQLAARLEKTKQNILNSIAAIQTNNEKVLEQVDMPTARALQDQVRFIETLRTSGVSQAEIDRQAMDLNRQIAGQNFEVGGGCSGGNKGEFKDGPNGTDSNAALNSESADKKDWKWKSGVCQVRSCPSPKPTEVGPCSVCRNCQHQFDRGLDPTKAPAPSSSRRTDIAGHINELLASFSKAPKMERPELVST
jgi:hypothetical protein